MRIASQSDPHSTALSTVDYLLIGHLSEDKTPDGTTLGGTVCYAGLTAHALGHSVGLVTAAHKGIDLNPIKPLRLAVKDSPQSTVFENIYREGGRVQNVHSQAVKLSREDIPAEWSDAGLVHIAPLIGELSIDILRPNQGAFIGLTPQGLMRKLGASGEVVPLPWSEAAEFIKAAHAVVVSMADLNFDRRAVGTMASQCSVMVLTDGPEGVEVWADREKRSLQVPQVSELDATGAGDIFAAAFFSRFHATGNPWTSATTAIRLAAISVTRAGLAGAPTPEEARTALRLEGE